MTSHLQQVRDDQLDEWFEWAAYNLAADVGQEKVRATMIESGLPAASVDRFLQTIDNDPSFRAARRHAGEVRKWTSLMDALMSLEKMDGSLERIPRRSNLSCEEFLSGFYCRNRPVILTDVVTHWPAFHKWDLDYLSQHYGRYEIRYQSGRSGPDFYRTFSDNRITAPFADYIDLIRKDDRTNDYYLIAHDRALERPGMSGLIRDMEFDPRYFDGNDLAGRLFFWLGPKGSMTHMHRDLGNVFLAQIMGRKQVKFVPAKQLHLIYNEFEYYSEANFDTEDFSDFPKVDEACVMREVIEPGELLFIPVGWWHFVKSLDIAISVTMTNFRHNNDLPRIF